MVFVDIPATVQPEITCDIEISVILSVKVGSVIINSFESFVKVELVECTLVEWNLSGDRTTTIQETPAQSYNVGSVI